MRELSAHATLIDRLQPSVSAKKQSQLSQVLQVVVETSIEGLAVKNLYSFHRFTRTNEPFDSNLKNVRT